MRGRFAASTEFMNSATARFYVLSVWQVYSSAEVIMAEWQYRIQRITIQSDTDSELESALADYGKKGWELVEILPESEGSGSYRLIFKSPKPLD
jgi:hypothetical protein